MDAVFSDAVSPAICMNEGCDFTCEMEPDQDAGYCEECHTNTMKAAPVLAGLIRWRCAPAQAKRASAS
jgi:hypothetical protein